MKLLSETPVYFKDQPNVPRDLVLIRKEAPEVPAICRVEVQEAEEGFSVVLHSAQLQTGASPVEQSPIVTSFYLTEAGILALEPIDVSVAAKLDRSIVQSGKLLRYDQAEA